MASQFPHCATGAETTLGRKLTPSEIAEMESGIQEEMRKIARENPQLSASELHRQAGINYAITAKLSAKKKYRHRMLMRKTRLEAVAWIQRHFPDDYGAGMKAFLVGSKRDVRGGRKSVAMQQDALSWQFMGEALTELERAGLTKWARDVANEQDIARAMWQQTLLPNSQNWAGITSEARQFSQIMHGVQERVRIEANKAGASIGDLQGYVMTQTHDVTKLLAGAQKSWHMPGRGPQSAGDVKGGFVRSADYAAARQKWKDTIRDLLDERTFDAADDEEEFLDSVFDALASGLHLRSMDPETIALKLKDMGYRSPASMAQKMSEGRVLHFKDADSFTKYNQAYGHGRMVESMFRQLEHRAHNVAIMRAMGPNPDANFNLITEKLANFTAKKGVQARRNVSTSERMLRNYMAELTGEVNIPGNHMAAKVSATMRAIQSMAKLGAATISAVSDLAFVASELRYEGMTYPQAWATTIQALFTRATPERRQAVAKELGVVIDGMRGDIAARFTDQEYLSGKTNAAVNAFFKLNLLQWWTDRLKVNSAIAISQHMSSHAGKALGALPDDVTRILRLYDVDDQVWDMMRERAVSKHSDYEIFSPEAARSIPDSDIDKYLKAQGFKFNKNTKPLVLQNWRNRARDSIEQRFRALFNDRAQYAVISPDAEARAFMKQGLQPGTFGGEAIRFASQFKSFPVAVMNRPLAREWAGKRTVGEQWSTSDVYNVAQLILMTTALGAVVLEAKAAMRGQERPEVESTGDAAAYFMAAMLQGGALGIYGDFLVGSKTSRFGGGPLDPLLGPTWGTAQSAVDIVNTARDKTLEGESAMEAVARKGFSFAKQNTPFMNVFYIRPVLDYMILHGIQESLSPGSLRRAERALERDHERTYREGFAPSELNFSLIQP
jgi:hypothetical protein